MKETKVAWKPRCSIKIFSRRIESHLLQRFRFVQTMQGLIRLMLSLLLAVITSNQGCTQPVTDPRPWARQSSTESVQSDLLNLHGIQSRTVAQSRLEQYASWMYYILLSSSNAPCNYERETHSMLTLRSSEHSSVCTDKNWPHFGGTWCPSN
jgi:hypothetical protein